MRDRGVTWFPELVDKRELHHLTCFVMYSLCDVLGKSIKVHLYWAMKNSGGCPDTLRKLITNIPDHYQVCPVR